MGTSAFEVLFQLRGHERILIVDAVINTGEAPGTLYKLPAHEVEAAIQDDPNGISAQFEMGSGAVVRP